MTKYENINLYSHYRMGTVSVTLQKWIDKEMYDDPNFDISEIRDSEGNNLPWDVIPKEYRDRYHNSEARAQPVGGISNLIRSVRNLLNRAAS